MRLKRIIFSLALFLLFMFLFAWVGKEVIVKQRGTRSDFFAIWYGCNLTLQRTSPYSPEATLFIHENLSGRPIGPRVYVHSFPYPAYLVVDLLPFAALPYSTAFIAWTGIQLPILFVALYLLTKFLAIELNKLELVILFTAGSVGFLYPLVSYALGQISIFLLFLLTSIFFLAKKMKIIGAGILLAFTAIRPDIFILTSLVVLIILWKSKQAAKQLAFTAIASLVAMNIISVFLLGFWYFAWLGILLKYSSHNPKAHVPLEVIPDSRLQIVIVLILFAYLLWQFFQFTKEPTQSNQLLVISTIFLVYAIAFKVTGSYHLTLLLVPALILLRLYRQYPFHWLMWLMLLIPWLFYGLTGRTDSWANLLLVPVIFLGFQAPLFWLTNKHHAHVETA